MSILGQAVTASTQRITDANTELLNQRNKGTMVFVPAGHAAYIYPVQTDTPDEDA